MHVTSRVLAAWLLAVTYATAAGAQHAQGGSVVYHGPQWSRDGRWILVSANLHGDSEIYLIRTDGRELKQLTRNAYADDMARWSDDGRRILFMAMRPEGEAEFSMAADGSDVRPVPRDSVSGRSPDRGTLLVETVQNGRGRVYAVNADRTGARLVSRDRHAEQATFSPDGTLIVYEERDAIHEKIELSDIVVAKADGSDARTIATGTDPSWSPDGQSILFKVFDEKDRRLWITTIGPTGDARKRLAPGVHPQWSPDGRRIVSMRDRADGGADVWIMNHDGSDARCLTCSAPFR